METIYNRRSIRRFKQDKVDITLLKKIIKAGMNAPSAVGQQPWQFVIIDDKRTIEQVVDVHPNAKPAMNAPVSILVCGDLNKERAQGYWPIDCAAATQNLLLMITDAGLGGCWLGIYPRQERVNRLRELIKAPEHIVPFSLIALGYPDESLPPKDSFDQNRIFLNAWNKNI